MITFEIKITGTLASKTDSSKQGKFSNELLDILVKVATAWGLNVVDAELNQKYLLAKIVGNPVGPVNGTDQNPSVGQSLLGTLEGLEKQAIKDALAKTGNNREKAAKILGIGERTLYRKIREYNL